MKNVLSAGAGVWPPVRKTGRWGVSRRLAAVIATLLAVEAALPFALHTSFRRLTLLAGPLLALAPLAYFPWLGLPALLSYAPFAPAIRFTGASSLQSLLKDIFALVLVVVWGLRVLVERRRWIRTSLDVWIVLLVALLALQSAARAVADTRRVGAEGPDSLHPHLLPGHQQPAHANAVPAGAVAGGAGSRNDGAVSASGNTSTCTIRRISPSQSRANRTSSACATAPFASFRPLRTRSYSRCICR